MDVAPPMETTRSCEPVSALAGTVTFTWYRPTELGERPLKITVAGTPPMLTEGVSSVCTKPSLVGAGYGGVGYPVGGCQFTGPNPFIHNIITWSRWAGFALVIRL